MRRLLPSFACILRRYCRKIFKNFLSNWKNTDARNTFLVENILSLDLDNFALYVTLRDTVSGSGNLQTRSLEKDC